MNRGTSEPRNLGTSSLERSAIRRISWRLLPLIVVIYFVAYIDRSNVGFAALGMNKDLGFSAYLYGWGAGIFFLGYFIFEVPSNLVLERVGARRWIARIMITWGLVSGAMAFVQGPISFLTIRFLLGVAEAGFFPGVLLYFTYWFPAEYRARVVSAIFIAAPASNAVSATLSGAILETMNGVWGLAGWKWMFILESAPAVLLAPVVLKVLTDKPALATWMPADERAWLDQRLGEERARIEDRKKLTLREALTDRRVLLLSMVYLTIVTATYGITFFLPLIVKSHGFSNMDTGLITAVPYVVGVAGLIFWSRSSDLSNERRWHYIVGALIAAVGFVGVGLGISPVLSLISMSVAAVGLYGCKPPLWAVPSQFLSGTAAAGGIALMNSIGNLGGFLGPYIVGWIRESTQSYEAGLYFLAACAAASAVIALFVIPRRH
jgi:ACS family tartrate transporter-like MFS transporter